MTLRPTRATRWRAGVVVVVAVAAVILATRGAGGAQPPATSTQPTSWVLPKLAGTGTVKLTDLRGHPVVLDFFASWCTACRGELPGMAALSHQLAGRVTFAGVDSQETGDGLAMARQYGVDTWPLARDVGGSEASGLHDALGARGMPLTAFYDSSGRLLTVILGAISEDDLRSRIQSLYGITA
ncbi:MAG: TlpA family protein disulfide reductase [Candidatus Dormibacteraeota bacterium]|nr:TlpA family protein disulfide reductase [Candidatus Dormibacteraeota bacterium]